MNKASACGDRLNAALHAGLAECGGPVVVGYSGGLDSTVLLHALANLPESRNVGLRAVHVNHGLHPDSDDWARRCHQVCQTLGISLSVVNVEVRSQGDRSEERRVG